MYDGQLSNSVLLLFLFLVLFSLLFPLLLAPPTVIVDPRNETGVEEWTSFSLSCTVRADASFIIYWRKLNDTLPVNISTMNTTTSTNTVSLLVFINSN